MEALIPALDRRDAVVAEFPRLPLSYFQSHVPVPEGWTTVSCTYVLLSDAYRHEAEEAAARGWVVIELPGSHLDFVTRPVTVAEALDEQAAVDRAPGT